MRGQTGRQRTKLLEGSGDQLSIEDTKNSQDGIKILGTPDPDPTVLVGLNTSARKVRHVREAMKDLSSDNQNAWAKKKAREKSDNMTENI